MESLDLSRPLFSLTIGEFLAIRNEIKEPQATVNTPEKKYVYGLAGLARLLGCSHPTAHRIKESGKIPYSQIGRKLVFDSEEVLSAVEKKKIKV